MEKHITPANFKPSRLSVNLDFKRSDQILRRWLRNLSNYLDWYLHQRRKGTVHSQIFILLELKCFRCSSHLTKPICSANQKKGSAISEAKYQRKHNQFFGINLWDWPRQMIVAERHMCQVLHFKQTRRQCTCPSIWRFVNAGFIWLWVQTLVHSHAKKQ